MTKGFEILKSHCINLTFFRYNSIISGKIEIIMCGFTGIYSRIVKPDINVVKKMFFLLQELYVMIVKNNKNY